MKLQNDYKVLYSANERVTEEAPSRLYAFKSISASLADPMVKAFNSDTGAEVDAKAFKLIYAVEPNLYGSLSSIPTESDVRFYLATADGEVVFGEGADIPPVVTKYTVTTNEVEHCVVTGAGEYEEGSAVTITIKPEDAGYLFDGEPTITINDESVTFTTKTETECSYVFNIQEDSAAVLTANVKIPAQEA